MSDFKITVKSFVVFSLSLKLVLNKNLLKVKHIVAFISVTRKADRIFHRLNRSHRFKVAQVSL